LNTNNKLPNPNLEYSEALSLDLEEAALALHALRFYISGKGPGGISENTTSLESKLDSFINRRLGYDKMTVEVED